MTSPPSAKHSLELLDLPPELLLYTFTLLTFPSLASLRRCSHSLNHLITTSSELLYRRIAWASGFTEEAGVGASTAAAAGRGEEGGLGLSRLRECWDGEELGRAVKAQRCMSRMWEGVKSWEEFARRRLALDKRWLKGQFQERWIVVGDAAGFGGLFRFKLDPEPNHILASGLEGGNYVFNAQGELVWDCELPTSPYPHIEASNGYFTQMISEQGNRFLCWRRSDITCPPSPLSAELISSFTSRSTHHLPSSSSPDYTPFAILDAPGATNATKLRYPYHLGASSEDRKLYRFDLSSLSSSSSSSSPNESLTTIDISPLWSATSLADPSIHYVELLHHYSLIAGAKSITIWHPDPDRGCIATFPPTFPKTVAREDEFLPVGDHYRSERRERWSAVHHDVRADEGGEVKGNLVAVSYGERGGEGGGKLMWTPRVGALLAGAEALQVASMTVVLQAAHPIVQLAVENGRCAFITSGEGHLNALWLLNLREFTSIADFAADPPTPICIAYPLPTLCPPSRLELTTDEMLLPSSSIFACPSLSNPTGGGALHRDLAELQEAALQLARSCSSSSSSSSEVGVPGVFSWQTMEGGVMKRWEQWGERQEGMVERAWRGLMNRAARMGEGFQGSDAFVAYGFGG